MYGEEAFKFDLLNFATDEDVKSFLELFFFSFVEKDKNLS